MNKGFKKFDFILSDGISKLSEVNSDSFVSKHSHFSLVVLNLVLFGFILFCGATATFSQGMYQNNNFAPGQTSRNYMANSTAFRQEIARVDISVVRQGRSALPITEVPRLQKGDVLKVRMLDEPVNGVKPDQSNYDWTFLIAFVNPGRNADRETSASEEIRFRKSGWYKEYSFTVPYDNQPIFFLYPKPEYRSKILNLISKNQDEIRKIGEKTIEISSAYAKIGSFLNELQSVISRSQYNRSYGGYGGYSSYATNNTQNFFMEQAVERIARSFNIQLPNCWQGNAYNSGGYNNNGYNAYGMGNDIAGRVQCVAKNVRLEDFDLSVSRMLQQGGILAAAQLSQKYPQLAFWINIAAVALDFILQITKKTPLKLVPTVITTSEYRATSPGYQNNYSATNPYQPPLANLGANGVKISLFAESSPNDNGFVTAYPLVVHKWQADADPEVISLLAPILAEACLREGQNLLRNTDLTSDWLADSFTKDFRLIAVSANGFRKEFPLTKNLGLGGWELYLTKEDLNTLPKNGAPLEAVVAGKRGFNEVRTPKFELPAASASGWTVDLQSVMPGATHRSVVLKNGAGCRCLQAVVYKPQAGGEIVFEAGAQTNTLNFSADGSQVSFELNAAQSGGQLELRLYGGETSVLSLNLYPPPPVVSDLKIARGDREAVIFGIGLEQIRAIKINGKRTIPVSSAVTPGNGRSFYASSYMSQIGENDRIEIPSAGERTFAFVDPTARQDSSTVSLELELDGNRIQPVSKTFLISAARPVIAADQANEIEGIVSGISGGATSMDPFSTGKKGLQTGPISQTFFPAEVSKLSVSVQNVLTDYDFNAENLWIEVRIENSSGKSGALREANFEVLDWKNLRLTIDLNNESREQLFGKRLQFRIHDKIRGDSDWYTIKQIFVRLPQSLSVKCQKKPGNQCELNGRGIHYIQQVSVDGGKTWFPRGLNSLLPKSTNDEKETVMIPYYSNKKLLLIKLKDLPEQALNLPNYIFANASQR